MIVGITASRRFKSIDSQLIDSKILDLVIAPNVNEIVFGGAKGGDTIALKAALLHRAGLYRPGAKPSIPKLVVIVPDVVRSQPPETWAITERADEVVELHLPIIKDDGWLAYRKRNEAIVDRCNRMVAFWTGSY